MQSSNVFLLLGFALGLALPVSSASGATALELTKQQQQFLAQVEQRLSQAKVNAKSAEDSAGSANKKPSASQTKLALTRAAQARGQVDTVKDALAQLPAEDPAVKAVADACAELEKSITALETRLGASAAPPSTGGAKLSSQDEQKLKDAAFYIREVEGAANALDEVVAKVKATADENSLEYQLLASAKATIDKARSRKAFIDERLSALPADGAGVADGMAQSKAVYRRIDDAEATLQPVHERLQRIVDPANNPTLDADVVRIQAFAGMFGDLTLFEIDPLRAASIVLERPAAGSELERITKTYSALLQQDTDASRRLRSVSSYLTERLTAFDRATDDWKVRLPAIVDEDLGKALRMTEEAVADKKPMFFQGGIPQAIETATHRVELLVAIDSAAGAKARAALETTKGTIVARQTELRDLIIDQNPLPPDRYAGGDKPSLIERATAAWDALEPGAKVLAVRFPAQEWKRETMWRNSNSTWYLIDRSRLQAQLIVRFDDRIAVIRPIDLWIDHVNNDAKSANPMHSGVEEALQPSSFLLIDKVK